MDWNRMKEQWQDDALAAPGFSIDSLRRQDEKLRRRVTWRDRLETAAAALVVVWFTLTAMGVAAEGNWLGFAFALLLVAWGVMVPLWLRRT